MRPRMRKSVVKHLHLNVTQPFARRNRLNLDLDRAVDALPVYQIWLAKHAKLLNNKHFNVSVRQTYFENYSFSHRPSHILYPQL